MSVKRWVLTDPYDTNAATNRYTFPRNPEAMTSLNPERQISSLATLGGQILLHEGNRAAKQWQFNGPILDKAHYDALYEWVYNKRRRVRLTDHFGRTISLVFSQMEAVPRRRVNVYWSHDYTISALVLAVSAATVTDDGPTP
jgi:hypothetical protein